MFFANFLALFSIVISDLCVFVYEIWFSGTKVLYKQGANKVPLY